MQGPEGARGEFGESGIGIQGQKGDQGVSGYVVLSIIIHREISFALKIFSSFCQFQRSAQFRNFQRLVDFKKHRVID